MPMIMKKCLALVTVAVGLLVSGNATDADDKLLSSMSMQETTMAYYTASVIAYPSVCQTKLSDKMKAKSAGMAAKHGETLMRLVRVKMMEPDIESGRDQWCSKIA